MTHAKFLHVGKLAKAVTADDTLQHIVVLFLGHRENDVDAGLVDSQDVGRRKDADIRRYDRSGSHALAVARHTHVTHHVDVGHVSGEEVDGRLRRFGHTLHELLLLDVPLVGLPRRGVDHGLADAAVGTTDADVLVRTSEAALGMALEVSQGNQRIVVSQGLAHRHLLEPLSALDRQHCGALGIHDIDGAERPSVHLQRLAVLVGGVAVALIVGVGLHDGGILQVLLHQRLHPFARQDVGTVLLAGMQFHGHLALDVLVHFLVSRNQSFSTEVAGEIDYGFIARTLIIVHILAAIGIARRITPVRLCLLRITAGHHSSTKAQQKSSSNQFVHSFCLLSLL